MSWDDNWTRALVTILAAAAGAIVAALVNAYAANRKIREVELQYLYKLRDGYLENARKYIGEVYIPIGVALTNLSNCYQRFSATLTPTATPNMKKAFRDDFESECLSYLQSIDSLIARGADAYLTTALDERLNDFTNFIRGSLDQTTVVKRRVLQASFSMWPFGTFATPAWRVDRAASSRAERVPIPDFSWNIAGFGFGYTETVLGAPFDSREFELRIKTEIPQLKYLIKEVTLGSHSPA